MISLQIWHVIAAPDGHSYVSPNPNPSATAKILKPDLKISSLRKLVQKCLIISIYYVVFYNILAI